MSTWPGVPLDQVDATGSGEPSSRRARRRVDPERALVRVAEAVSASAPRSRRRVRRGVRRARVTRGARPDSFVFRHTAAARVAHVIRTFGIVAARRRRVLAAGCGVRRSTPFPPTAQAGCLRSHGFTGVTTIRPGQGRVHRRIRRQRRRAREASPEGNVLTIAFTADAALEPDVDARMRSGRMRRRACGRTWPTSCSEPERSPRLDDVGRPERARHRRLAASALARTRGAWPNSGRCG